MKLLSFLVVGLFLSSFPCLGEDKKGTEKKLDKNDYKELVTTTSCEKKTHCLLIYVAPWCPACQKMSPIFNTWKSKMENDPDYGIKIIVGMGKPEENEEFAKRYDEKVTIIDKDNRYHELLKVQGFPSMKMVRNDGVITLRDNKEIFGFMSPRYMKPQSN